MPQSYSWPVVSAFPLGNSLPSPQLPPSITTADILAWMDGRLTMYSDSGGTTPQGGYLGSVYRVNEAGPLTSNWSAVAANQTARRDQAGLRFDFTGVAAPAMPFFRANAVNVSLNNCTMVIVYTERDGFGGPDMGLAICGPTSLGIYGGAGGVGLYVNGGLWQSAITVTRATKCTAVARWTPTQANIALLANGVTSTDALVTTVTAGTNTTAFELGFSGAGTQGFYGSIAQFLVINRAVSDLERSLLLQWGDAQEMSPGYPVASPLLAVTGDSIARVGVGAGPPDGWCWQALKNIRSTKGADIEMCNVAITGSGVVGTYAAIAPYYVAARAKNVAIFASGTNDLANNNGSTYTINNLYAQCDLARAQGWKVVICTIIDRSGLFGGGATQTSFNTDRATTNTNIQANWASHADALADVGAVAGVGNVGDSLNLTNFTNDGVHPTAAGHLLMEPTIRAAILSLL